MLTVLLVGPLVGGKEIALAQAYRTILLLLQYWHYIASVARVKQALGRLGESSEKI